MSKTISRVLIGTIVVFIVFAVYALASDVYSDTRDSRDRETTGRTTEPTVTPPPPLSPPTSKSPPSGGITSLTSGSVDTGGNTGGQVTTGDEHVEVFEINVGPTNPPPTPPTKDEDKTTSPGRTRTR